MLLEWVNVPPTGEMVERFPTLNIPHSLLHAKNGHRNGELL